MAAFYFLTLVRLYLTAPVVEGSHGVPQSRIRLIAGNALSLAVYVAVRVAAILGIVGILVGIVVAVIALILTITG